MKILPEVTYRGVEKNPIIEELITKGLTKLEQVCDYIIATRIAIEWVQRRHQTINPYRIRIYITVPDQREIVVERYSVASKKTAHELAQKQTEGTFEEPPEVEASQPSGRSSIRKRWQREEPLQAMIRRAFESARRELQKTVEKQRGEVKTHAEELMSAVVERILRDQGYGFLRTLDGEQIYFHKNSVLHNHWENLRPGTAVRFSLEEGEKGPQATTVEPIERPGAAETHGELHELPPSGTLPRPRKRRVKQT